MRGSFHIRERKVGEDDLQAFVDGALGKRRRRQVEIHLACHPEDAVRVDGYARQLEVMRELRAQPAGLPGNPVLSELVRAFGERLDRRRRLRRLAAAVAVLGMLSAAGATGLLLDPRRDGGARVASVEDEPAWLFHSSLMGDTGPVVADAGDSLGWLGGRIGHRALRRPDLEALGLRYVSSSVLHATEPPVVRLIYEDALGKRLFVYVAVLLGETEGVFGVVPEGYVSLQWRRGPLVFALIAPSDSPQLTATMQVVSSAMVEEPIPDAAVAKVEAPAAPVSAVTQAAAGGGPAPGIEAGGELRPATVTPPGATDQL